MAAISVPTVATQQGTPVAAEARAAEDTEANPEKQRLDTKATDEQCAVHLSSFLSLGCKRKKQQDQADDDDDAEWDSTQYDITRMTTWSAFGMVKGCAWDNPVLWCWIGLASLLATVVAVAVSLMPNSVLVNPGKLAKLGSFLNVFVGLLLGFFLSSSMYRWYGCVDAFLTLLDAVRSMQMQMTALGVSPEKSCILSRYGILSAWLLQLSLSVESDDDGSKIVSAAQERENSEKVWQQLEQLRPQLVLPHEKKKLMPHNESYALVWTWVASLIGRMSQDGEIPPMASPTYGRILNIVQDAYGSIRNVRELQLIKAPYVYVHTLAILVHINNILNAISFGTILGITFSGSFIHEVKVASAANMNISLFMQFFFSMLAPVLYLALLDVSIHISQPFQYHDARIPAVRYIRCLEEDLQNSASLGDNPPHWDKPYYKTK